MINRRGYWLRLFRGSVLHDLWWRSGHRTRPCRLTSAVISTLRSAAEVRATRAPGPLQR